VHHAEEFVSKMAIDFKITSFNGVSLFVLDSAIDMVDSSAMFWIGIYNFLKLFYIIYIHEASLEEIMKNIGFWQMFPASKFYFIVNTNEHFYDLVVIEKFSETECSVFQSRVINRYSKQQMVWEKPMTRLTRDVDYHNCEKCFSIRSRIAGGIVTKTETGIELTGAVKEILEELAKMLHLKMRFRLVDNKTDRSCILLEIQPVFTMLAQTILVPIFQNDLVFVIPDGAPYSDWEILLLAFDDATWYLIIATFAASFGSIVIIKLYATTAVQHFIFGNDVTTPALNVLIAFFGLGQIILPTRNFARFLLTLFIIWSLIIRTCYQGKLFEYLQSDNRRPAMQTIDEVLRGNFTYFVGCDHMNLIDNNKYIMQIINVSIEESIKKRYNWTGSPQLLDESLLSRDDWEFVLQKYLESPSESSILITDSLRIIDYNKNKTNKPLKFLKERIFTFHEGFLIVASDFTKSSLENAVQNLNDNGFINYLFREQYDPVNLNPEQEPTEPEVLTLAQLAIGFKLYGCFLGLSIAVFVLEFVNYISLILRLMLIKKIVKTFC